MCNQVHEYLSSNYQILGKHQHTHPVSQFIEYQSDISRLVHIGVVISLGEPERAPHKRDFIVQCVCVLACLLACLDDHLPEILN